MSHLWSNTSCAGAGGDIAHFSASQAPSPGPTAQHLPKCWQDGSWAAQELAPQVKVTQPVSDKLIAAIQNHSGPAPAGPDPQLCLQDQQHQQGPKRCVLLRPLDTRAHLCWICNQCFVFLY